MSVLAALLIVAVGIILAIRSGALIATLTTVLLAMLAGLALADVVGPPAPPARPLDTPGLVSTPLELCPPPPARRQHCLHDADSGWIAGVKYRFAGFDAPELRTIEGEAARAHALELLRGGFRLRFTGLCVANPRDGRPLAFLILRDGRGFDEAMVAAGHGEPVALFGERCELPEARR